MDLKKLRQDLPKSRCFTCLIDALERGFKLDREDVLLALAKGYYKTGKHRSPCYIRNAVKTNIKYLKTIIS